MTKTALITGIKGQDGSYLADLLLEKGYRVYGLGRRSSTPNIERIEHIINKIELLDGDLTDQTSLNRAIEVPSPMKFIISQHNHLLAHHGNKLN